MVTLRMAAILAVLGAGLGAEAFGEPAGAAGDTNKLAPPVVALKVKREQNTKKTSSVSSSTTWRSVPGGNQPVSQMTVTKSADSSVRLAIEVRSLSNRPVTVMLEWYFLAKAVDSAHPWVFDRGSKALALPGFGPAVVEAVESQTLTSTATTSTSSGRSESGSKIAGYIVLVKADGRVLKAVASSKALEDVADSPDALQKLTVKPEAGK